MLKKFIYHRYVILSLLWAGVIFYFSSLPASALPVKSSVISSIAHIIEYTIFGYLLIHAIKRLTFSHNNRFVLHYVLIVGICYALLDEIHQLFVLGRHFNIVDIGFDIIGLLIGATFVYSIIPTTKKDN